MPETCTIQGTFTRHGHPVPGWIRFTPYRLWVVQKKLCWASLAPHVQLDVHGAFSVGVTPTDSDAVPWYYRVETPAGTFAISVPYREPTYTLRELVDVHHLGTGSPL